MKAWVRCNPTTAMFLAFFIAACSFAYIPGIPKLAVVGAIFLFAVLLLIRPVSAKIFREDKLLKKGIILVLAAAAAAGTLSYGVFDVYSGKIDEAAGKSETASFHIIECEKSYPYITYYKATVEKSELLPKGAKVILSTPRGGLYDDDEVEAEVTYHSLSEKSTNVFDGRGYYLSKGITIFAETDIARLSGNAPRFDISKFFGGIRGKISSAIRANCSEKTGGLAAAILLGEKSGLDPSVTRDFRRCGISHLLVISGTHFSALIMLLEFALRRMKFRPRARAVVNIVFALAFMCLTGFTPSVIRAGVMHLIAQISVIVLRKPNMVNSYAISGFLMVLINPFSVLDVGLQLSYVSTFACIVYLENRGEIKKFLFRREKREKKIHGNLSRLFENIADSVLLTFTVTLFTLPLSWMYFGEISLISIPMNVIAVPLVSVMMYVTAAYVLLYPIYIFIVPLAKLIDVYGGFLLSLFGGAARLKGALVSVSYPFTPLFIVPLIVLIVLIPVVKRKKYVFSAAAIVFAAFICTIGIVTAAERGKTSVTYLPAGKNDGLIVKNEGKVMLVDMSSAAFGYSYDLANEAQKQNVTEIDTIMLTHYHNKHVTCFGNICEREIVSTLVLPEPQTEEENAICAELCDTAGYYGVKTVVLDIGEEYAFGKVTAAVYPRTYLGRTSHPISGVKVETEDETLVLVSSSWNESDADIRNEIETAEYVLFGEHNPVYKNKYSVVFSEDIKYISAGESAFEYMDESTKRDYSDVISERVKTVIEW